MATKDLEGLVDETIKDNTQIITKAVCCHKEIDYLTSMSEKLTPQDMIKYEGIWFKELLDYSLDAYNFYRKHKHNNNASKQLALRDTLAYAVRTTYNSY